MRKSRWSEPFSAAACQCGCVQGCARFYTSPMGPTPKCQVEEGYIWEPKAGKLVGFGPNWATDTGINPNGIVNGRPHMLHQNRFQCRFFRSLASLPKTL